MTGNIARPLVERADRAAGSLEHHYLDPTLVPPTPWQAISHVLRLKEPHERLALLNITISTLPSMYVRGFKRTATNIVDYYEAMGDHCADPDLRSMVRRSKHL